jgi:hypothetical protein
MVIMAIMRALVEELPWQGLLGSRLVLEGLTTRCAWVFVIMSCRARPLMGWHSMDPAVVLLAQH